MKKVLITGASGFIGSFIVEEALHKGYDVYAAVRASSNKQFLQDPNIKFVELDLSNKEKLQQQFYLLQQEDIHFDYVIHNAGITHAKKGESFYDTNFCNTKNVVDALVASSMPLQKFVLTSSLAAYGPGNADTLQPIQQTDKKTPVSLYAKSKLLAEEYVASQKHFPYLVINPTGVYGPRDKAFLQFVQMIKSGWEPYVGRNKQMVSLIYVKDLAKAIIALLPSWCQQKSFIIADGFDYDKEEMGTIAKQVLQKKTIKLKLPVTPVRIAVKAIDKLHTAIKGYPPFLNSEKIDEISQPNWLCDSREIWSTLNDQPAYNLESGLKETIEWYQANNWL
jgi:nucleoside-diphosphate-sugar epimerase